MNVKDEQVNEQMSEQEMSHDEQMNDINDMYFHSTVSTTNARNVFC